MEPDRSNGGPILAARFRVTGRVQGVGFRHFTCCAARDCGVGGWVRNLPDGSVEAVAQGDQAGLERFAAVLAAGPPWGRVERIERGPAAVRDDRAGFDVRY